MKNHLLRTGMLALSLFLTFQLSAQVSISPDNSPANPSAGLDVNFPNKGLLPPRMTFEQRNNIANPAEGLMVFCTNCGLNSSGSLSIFMNGLWYTLNASCPPPVVPTEGTHVPSPTQIVWNWNTVSGATGYKWNTTNDYGTATDMGAAITKTEIGLTCNTAYTRYAWAYSACGNSTAATLTQTSAVCAFSCGTPMTDTRDGKTYNTVLIGTQCWFAQNLNIGTRINGTIEQTNNSIIEKYCHNDLESNCDVYGGLYQWDEAMQYSTTEGVKGICPTGWHLPTDAEWCSLTQFLDPSVYCNAIGITGTNAGGKMKEAGLTHWASPNTGATNSSGFTALPGGYRDTNGGFYGLTYGALFWSSFQNAAATAWDRSISGSEGVGRYSDYKADGFSVRCVQD